jgi:hypothetical protein
MSTTARLIEISAPADPMGVVLVLHGGASRRQNMMVSPAQLSVLRMVPIARRIARAGKGELAVFRLLNSVRGWDTKHTPVEDARWALRQLSDRFGGARPACLVGHSLRGRAALLAAGEPAVRSAVALAPWVYPTDTIANAGNRDFLIIHGTADRIASPANSAAVARSLSRTASHVGYVAIKDGKHAMLKRHRSFDGLAADFAVATLLGRRPAGSVGQVLGGERWLEI